MHVRSLPPVDIASASSQPWSLVDRIYGVTCIQTFHYFRSQQSKTDAWYLRNVVGTKPLVVLSEHADDPVRTCAQVALLL